MCVYICVCTYVCMCIYVCVCICVCICVCLYVYVYVCVCMCVYMYVCVYICVCVSMCVCVYIYIYLPSLLTSHPSESSPSTQLSSLHYTVAPCQLSFFFFFAGYLFYTWWYICVNAPLSTHPTLFFPHCAHKFIFYVCVSIPSLKIGSSVPSF